MLQHAQTFVGVLATIVVLYLYHSNSNFFSLFLGHLKDEVEGIISTNTTNLFEKVDKKFLYKSSDKITFYKSILDSTDSREKELQQNIFAIDIEAKKIPVAYMSRSNKWALDCGTKMELLKTANEFEYIAFYMFFFSILMLFLDSVHPNIGTDGFWSSFVDVFTISSSVFILLLWMHLWRKTSPEYVAKETLIKDDLKNKKPQRNNRYYLILNILFCFILVPSFLIELSFYIKNFHLGILVIWLSYLMCFILGGSIYFNKLKYTLSYNRHFIFSHFAYIFFASLLVGLIIQNEYLETIVSSIVDRDINWTREKVYHIRDIDSFRIYLVSFITINIVAMPFVLSYAKSKFNRVAFNCKIWFLLNVLIYIQQRVIKNKYKTVFNDIERYKTMKAQINS